MISFSHHGTDVFKDNGLLLHFAKPLLTLHVVKLMREGVAEEEGVHRTRSKKGRGRDEARDGEWVSRDRETEGSTPVFASSATRSGFFRMALATQAAVGETSGFFGATGATPRVTSGFFSLMG